MCRARRLCVALLLDIILPEPLHKGTTVHDLRDATLISVLRRLAFEPHFDNTWAWLEYVVCVA
jgi:hypothetical protein